MDEYLCLMLASGPGETEAGFKARLAAFWTHLLRTRPELYEKVYAEASKFEADGEALARAYMVEAAAIDGLEAELAAEAVAFRAPDRDDLFSKYEAAPPDWFWIEH